MKKNDKQRLFEVMSRLDKTFKPKLNEYDRHHFDPDPGYDEYSEWGIEKINGVPTLYAYSEHGGSYDIDWEFIYPDEQEFIAIENELMDIKNHPELKAEIDTRVKEWLQSYIDRNDYPEWTYPDPY